MLRVRGMLAKGVLVAGSARTRIAVRGDKMAYRLSVRKKQMLVAIHVLSVMAWFGGTCCMLLLGWSMRSAENGPQLLYTLSSMHIVDEALLKYPALVALISGVDRKSTRLNSSHVKILYDVLCLKKTQWTSNMNV